MPTYELDENDQYIRRINQINVDVAAKLRNIDPYYFEVVCKKILEKMGGGRKHAKIERWRGGLLHAKPHHILCWISSS